MVHEAPQNPEIAKMPETAGVAPSQRKAASPNAAHKDAARGGAGNDADGRRGASIEND
jgi:hypothetical protein